MEPGIVTQDQKTAGTWVPVVAESRFPESAACSARIGGWHILVVRGDDGFHALNDRCPHQAARLSTGRIRRGAIMCPLHGARFDIATGHCIGGAYKAMRIFPVRVHQGIIEILLPDTPPGMEDLPVTP
ncbi:MAG: Rieske (2Fe-2S) protein [Novosphingobium sp.]|jgi:3-phenylpropionate/trans-cinnamate dioxygenase ferredoxin subunit|nr:Rieske (2Fe-2S) protein [Novosphingobium sp.]